MFLHKYKTDVGTAYLASGSQKPKAGIRLSDWEGKATGSKVDSILKMLGSIPMFKEEVLEKDVPEKDMPKEEPKKKKAVDTLANKVREFASFLIPKE